MRGAQLADSEHWHKLPQLPWTQARTAAEVIPGRLTLQVGRDVIAKLAGNDKELDAVGCQFEPYLRLTGRPCGASAACDAVTVPD